MSKNILIIGSEGYLGSRLSPYLKKYGYNITGMDTGFFMSGNLTEPDDHIFIQKDARAIQANDIEHFDIVIMLAGISNDPFGHMTAKQIYDPTREYAIKIAAICKQLKIKFIYPSSASIYGLGSNKLLTEKDSVSPQTPYSLNKLQVEESLALIADEDFSPIALRLGTIYGISPRIRFDVVINMLCGLAITTKKVTLNSNGEAWRPHLHILDACEAFRCCINWYNEGKGLTVFIVGQNEDNYQIIEIAKIIHKNILGSELIFLNNDTGEDTNNLIEDRKIQDGVDKRTYKVSFNKIHQELPDFKCSWNVKEGIKDLLTSLENINLNSEIFNKKDFYRLQQIEYLHKNNKIDDDLFWIK
ncbi:MAG: SDR family oxidoreductase [Gammaproteobacteria bacterium]|nr:SDR family oxidoreductase [Gammaproteobacteria bacterium]